jgi:peroxiredoxin
VNFVIYRAPTIRAQVRTDDGDTPCVNVQVIASFHSGEADNQASFVEESEGRFRSQSLFPEQQYEVCALATGFVPNRLLRLKLPEGSFTELSLVLRRQPTGPAIGDFAPPFLVKTLDGDSLSLGDLRGKFVLLEFWGQEWDNSVQEIPRFHAVQKRFAKDHRLAMIGLCLERNPTVAIKAMSEKTVTWPQVLLRDQVVDSIVLDYNAAEVPKTFLIGPDGKVIAKEIGGDQVEQVVAEALSRK